MKIIISILLTFLGIAHANYNLVWEIDLLDNSIITGNGRVHAKTFELNNNAGLLIATYTESPWIDNPPPDYYENYKIAVVDNNGAVYFTHELPYGPTNPSGAMKSLQIQVYRNGNFIMYERDPDDDYVAPRFYDAYTYSNGTYEVNSLLTAVSNLLSVAVQPPFNSDYFYNVCGTDSELTNAVVKKYSFSLPQETISGIVSSGFSQDNYVLNWGSSSGTEYQIQSSTDLTNWVNVGSSIVGTGETMTWANHVTNSQAFYRVVED